MRLLIVFLAACASGFAGDVETTCFSGNSTISSQGAYSASCSGPASSASGGISYLGSASVEADGGGYWGGPAFSWASASVSIIEDYVLTVTGGSGGGFAEAQLSAYAQHSDPYAEAGATVSLGGCTAVAVPYNSFCVYPTQFLFNTPQILSLSVFAETDAGGPYPSEGVAGASWGQFDFFDAQGQPLSGVSYTLTEIPTPEPGTLPLLTGITCAALIALKRRRRS